jgi:hypothetical protein
MHNLVYEIERTEEGWELVIRISGLEEAEYSGYLNLETNVMTLVCDDEQYDNITETFTPYVYESLQELTNSILLLEMNKDIIINCYLFNYSIKCA